MAIFIRPFMICYNAFCGRGVYENIGCLRGCGYRGSMCVLEGVMREVVRVMAVAMAITITQ